LLCDQEGFEEMTPAGGAAAQPQQYKYYEIGVFSVLYGGCPMIDGIVSKT
jgi:hypothetical protein